MQEIVPGDQLEQLDPDGRIAAEPDLEIPAVVEWGATISGSDAVRCAPAQVLEPARFAAALHSLTLHTRTATRSPRFWTTP